jgi:hypothetical protein
MLKKSKPEKSHAMEKKLYGETSGEGARNDTVI